MAIKGRLRFEILRRDGHLCKYCGYGPPDVKLTVDHVVPTVLGGTDDPTNLVTACSKCNGGKASIMPDSPFVAQAKDDAMRWQVAWTTAVAEAMRDGERRKKDIAKVKKNYVAAYRGRHDENPILPEGWEASVGRWLDLGLPLAAIDKAIASSVGRRKLASSARWNYFAGTCWNMLRSLGDRARQIAEAAEAVIETWDQKVTRTVLETVELVWRDALKIENGRDPQPGELEAVRESASALYPEKVYSGAVLKAAYDAAEYEDTDLGHWIAGDDYFGADPFHIQVAKAIVSGWTSDDTRNLSPLTPDIWDATLRQAFAARDAGYDDTHVYEAANFSGIHNAQLIAMLTTASDSLKNNGDFYDAEVKECALTQGELDGLAAEAWAAKAQRDRDYAERRAAGALSAWEIAASELDNADGNAVTNSVSHEKGGE